MTDINSIIMDAQVTNLVDAARYHPFIPHPDAIPAQRETK